MSEENNVADVVVTVDEEPTDATLIAAVDGEIDTIDGTDAGQDDVFEDADGGETDTIGDDAPATDAEATPETPAAEPELPNVDDAGFTPVAFADNVPNTNQTVAPPQPPAPAAQDTTEESRFPVALLVVAALVAIFVLFLVVKIVTSILRARRLTEILREAGDDRVATVIPLQSVRYELVSSNDSVWLILAVIGIILAYGVSSFLTAAGSTITLLSMI